MKIGIATMNTEWDLEPAIAARHVEDRGFASMWFGEHTNIPTSRASPYPPGGDLPDAYLHMRDPIVSIAMAAAVTTTLELGTAVCLLLQHDPLILAKSLATVDSLCGGRVRLGIGIGWNREEFENHRPMPRWEGRLEAAEERVALLRELWRREVAGFSGRFHAIADTWVFPKPYNRVSVPVVVGSTSPRGIALAASIADGWMPVTTSVSGFKMALSTFEAELSRADRSAASVEVIAFCAHEVTAADLESYVELGTTEVLLGIELSGSRDSAATLLRGLDRLVTLRDSALGA